MSAVRAVAGATALLSGRQRRHYLPPPPIYLTASPSRADLAAVSDLMLACGHSCLHPLLLPAQTVDIAKLERALANSTVVVSAFCKEKFLDGQEASWDVNGLLGGILDVGDDARKLVGFGRAVSDGAVTASIHDVVVLPSLQRRGIGRKIVDRIVRILTNRGIYDISALCTDNQRGFFEKCCFGDDSLGSITMMYTGGMRQSP